MFYIAPRLRETRTPDRCVETVGASVPKSVHTPCASVCAGMISGQGGVNMVGGEMLEVGFSFRYETVF